MIPEWMLPCARWCMHILMPLVTTYHLVVSNVFLNTSATDAKGLEKLSNQVLIPFQYLFAGRLAIPIQEPDRFYYTLEQRFSYDTHVALKTTLSILSLPPSLVLGSALKSLAYLFPSSGARHFQIAHAISSAHVKLNTSFYKNLGIHSPYSSEKIPSLGYIRRPGDENNLRFEKEALRQIVFLLKKFDIPFWADCGTCLGAYRYGGSIPWDDDVDLAILQPDFENARHALSELDPSKYLVEDWSSRKAPKTFLRIYVKKTRTYLNLFHFAIDDQTLSTQCVLLKSNYVFFPHAWNRSVERFQIKTPLSLIFPLKIASFDGIDLPVPNQVKKYLQMRYGEDLSPVKMFDLKTGAYEKDLDHPYWKEAIL